MQVLPILLSDSYKQFHWMMYPKGITNLYSNMTPRSFKHLKTDRALFFGLQYYIKEYLISQWNENFFHQPKSKVVAQFKRFHKHFSNYDMPTEHIEKLHDLGYLPILIKALPEGSFVKEKIPFFTITNTHPEFAWLVNFLETQMSTSIWDFCVVATIAYEYRKILNKWADKTCDNRDFVKWQGHDFAQRGRSSQESTLNQAGHLLSFTGTDTIPSVLMLEEYYNANMEQELIASSVPASEHSIMTSYGKENEIDAFERILDQFPTGIVSVVSDSFDLWSVCTDFCVKLKNKILNRDGKLVIRPDCYDDKTQILTNSGWKYFSKLTETDLVAQVLDDGSREFVKPTKIVSQEYDGDMHSFTDFHGKVDLLVTPNHRMILSQNNRERIVEAQKLGRYGNYEQKMIRSASAPSDASKRLSEIEKLRIAFQADGSFCTGCGGNIIRFSFSKQRKIDRLKNILDNIGAEYSVYDLSDSRYEFHIILDFDDISKDFEWVQEKDLTKEWCQDFIEECSYWDSCRRSEDRFKFDTTNISVANKVEFIALSAGYGVLRSEYEDNRSDIFNDIFTLHILKDNTVGGQSWEHSIVPYYGKIYCVQVPTGRLFVKRNRCTMVCGNSGDPVNIVCGRSIPRFDDFAQAEKYYYGYVWDEKNLFMVDGKCYKVKIHSGNDFVYEPYNLNHSDKGVVDLLWDVFGGKINSKGYKELDPHIGVIYGDSISRERAEAICQRLADKGFASNNVVFGIGSYTYNYNTRDSLGIAVKSTYCEVDGVPREIFKDPVTDDGIKKSARGLLRVDIDSNGEYYLQDMVSTEHEKTGCLESVFCDGKLLIDQTLKTIRDRVYMKDLSDLVKSIFDE